MDFTAIPNLKGRKAADMLVLPFWKGKKAATAASPFIKLNDQINAPIETHDFTGKEGELLILYTHGDPEKRIALLGLGEIEKTSIEKLRRAFASLAKGCRSKKLTSLNLLPPQLKELTEEEVIRGVAEGLLLANYSFDQLKGDQPKSDSTPLLKHIGLIGASKQAVEATKKYTAIAKGVYLARDLANGNADDINPQHLAKLAHHLAKTLPHVKTTVFDQKRIEKEKMGLLLAVGRAFQPGPVLIFMEYQGNPKSKDHTVIVGKGITFDTGGLNLKSSGMETMKCDMGGAATAFGTLLAVATLGLKQNITVVVPATENSIGNKSYKPGDVYKAYSGKTVEIGNTDAEGRLVLADALAYVNKKLKPTRIIDFATLTGAMDIALGAETTGMMSNDDALANALLEAGQTTYERLCRLPLHEEYKDQLKSHVADIRNIGGRSAGSITAALFLQEFVGDTPWAHCDIAGTAFLTEARRYHPKHGTGIGVRLMVEFLEAL